VILLEQSSGRLRPASGSGRLARRRPCMLEPLEERALLTMTSAFAGGVLTFSGDRDTDVVLVRSLATDSGNSIQYEIGGGQVTQSGVTSIVLAGGAGNDVLEFSGNSTANSLSAVSSGGLELHGAIAASGSLGLRAQSITDDARIVAHDVEMFAIESLAVSGSITAAGGTISAGSGLAGSTMISGNLDASTAIASGKAGGAIYVYGLEVELAAASIDASGDAGGGTVLVGGTLHGAGLLRNAQSTTVGAISRISASALTHGRGGTVVVWSDSDTRIADTTIDAHGGPQGGDGGVIETSAGGGLQVVHTVTDAGSPAGTAGTWLVDPRNVTIASTATFGGAFGGGDPDVFTPSADNAIVNTAAIVASLNLGTSVTITTGATGSQDGDITVLDPIVRTAGLGTPTLTLSAARDIAIGGAISGAAGFGLNLALTAGRNTSTSAPINTFGGSLSSSGVDFANSLLGVVSTGILGGTITVDHSGAVTIGADLTAGTSISLHSGNDGSGDLTFAGSPNLNSAAINLQAGIGDGTQSTAKLDPLGATFRGAAGLLTSPDSFSLRQDADILDNQIPTVTPTSQFGDGVPAAYAIQSDGGSVSLMHGAKVAGSKLTIGGKNGVSISAPLVLESLSVTSAATLAGGTIATTDDQEYLGAVTLAADTILSGKNVNFTSTVDSDATARALTVNASVTTTFGGAVGNQIGGPKLASLATDAPGTTVIAGGAISTSGDQTYADAVTLAAGTVLTGANVSFLSTVDSDLTARSLTVDASGTTTFGGAVGNKVGGPRLASLATDAAGATVIGGGVVLTTGDQTYADAVTLTAGAVLTGANVSFLSTVDSDLIARALTVNASGVTTFGGAVGSKGGGPRLASLTTDAAGTTSFAGGAILTAGDQTYSDAVTLASPTTVLTGANLTLAAVTGAGFNLTLSGTAITTLNGPISGVGTLISNNGGTTLVKSTINATTLEMVDASTISGGAINTDQVYSNLVTLGANTVLSGANITLVGVTGNGFNLTLSGTLATTLNGAIAGVGTLRSDTGGTTFVNNTIGASVLDMVDLATLAGGAVSTVGDQTYSNAVTLAANTILTGVNVTFVSTVDSDATARSLTVNASGATTFGGAVGNKVGGPRLASLITDAAGTTVIAGGAILTTGNQNYLDAVTLASASTVLTGVNVTFASTVDSDATARSLTVNASGVTTFGGPVGNKTGGPRLASLTTDAAGTTIIAGGAVSTTGDQTYSDSVTLASASTVLTGANVTFASTVDSDATARSLTVNASGATTFGGPVGNKTGGPRLASLTTDAAGTTVIAGGAVLTTGDQTYSDPVTLASASTLLTGANVTFASTVDSDATARSLTVNASGATTFGGAVGNKVGGPRLANLTTDAAGTTVIAGGAVSTTGDQTYSDPVTLASASTILTGVNVTFASTVDSDATARSLTVNGSGVTTFGGAVGTKAGGPRLANLTTDAAGTTVIAGSAVLTSGDQTYSDPVTLASASTVLTGANVTFASTVDSDATARSLTVNASGATTFGGAVGSKAGGPRLANLTTDAPGTTVIAGGAVLTTGDQTYSDPVTLASASTILTGVNVTFASTVDSDATARSLTVNASGVTTFGGAVGNNVGGPRLASLTTDAAGTTIIAGGAVSTTGDQTYSDPVTLASASTVLTGVNVTFASTVDSDATARSLTVNASGETTFAGPVGNKTGGPRLASLTTDAAGTTAIAGGAVLTTGDQTYSDPVTLASASTLLTGANVTFASTVDSDATARSLTVNASGISKFGDAVGNKAGGPRLSSLTTDAAGTTEFSGGAVSTILAQTYGDAVQLDTDTVMSANSTPVVPATLTLISFGKTIAGPGGLTTTTKGTTVFAGAVGTPTALKFLDVTSGGPLAIKVNVTALQNITLRATKGADPAAGDSLTVGDPLNLAAVNKVLSTSGDIEFDADNDITLLANSIVQAAAGSITLKGDFSNKSAAGTQILLAGSVSATASVNLVGNTHDDTFTLAGATSSPAVNISGIGGLDVMNVQKTLVGTITNILGGDANATGNNVTVNVSSPAGTIDAIQGVLNIKGSPFDKLPPATRALVTYRDFVVPAGDPPSSITTLPLATTVHELKGNIVNVVDTNRAVATNNAYALAGSGLTRTNAAAINFIDDASGRFGIQTVTLKAGASGNNRLRVQLPEDIVAKPLTYVDVDGGQIGATNTNVLSVTGANDSAFKIHGTIGGAPIALNAIIAGDGSIIPDADQPIKFSHVASLYLNGSVNGDFIINNSTSTTIANRVFGLLDGRGGGDWLTTGVGVTAQDVVYGGGAPAGRTVFIFGRGTSTDINHPSGYLLANQSLATGDTTTFPGASYVDGGSGLYSAAADNGHVINVTDKVYLAAGSLNVVSWLRASFQRTPATILTAARNLVAAFPKP
jgi:mucin-19